MATYLVYIPHGDMPLAEVEADSTKHARTAYLDYLSRTGVLPFNQRQAARRLAMTKRMEPGEIRTQVQLDYTEGILSTESEGILPQGTEVKPIPTQPIVPMQKSPEPQYPEVQTQIGPEKATNPLDSPIGRLSRTTGGM